MSKVDHQWVSAPTALANDQCGAGFCLAKYSDHPQQARGAAMSDDLQDRLDTLENEYEALTQDIDTLKAERDEAEARAEAAEQQAARLRAWVEAQQVENLAIMNDHVHHTSIQQARAQGRYLVLRDVLSTIAAAAPSAVVREPRGEGV